MVRGSSRDSLTHTLYTRGAGQFYRHLCPFHSIYHLSSRSYKDIYWDV